MNFFRAFKKAISDRIKSITSDKQYFMDKRRESRKKLREDKGIWR